MLELFDFVGMSRLSVFLIEQLLVLELELPGLVLDQDLQVIFVVQYLLEVLFD